MPKFCFESTCTFILFDVSVKYEANYNREIPSTYAIRLLSKVSPAFISFPKYKGTSSLLFHRPILTLRLELHHAGIDTILFQERIRTALLRHCSFR